MHPRPNGDGLLPLTGSGVEGIGCWGTRTSSRSSVIGRFLPWRASGDGRPSGDLSQAKAVEGPTTVNPIGPTTVPPPDPASHSNHHPDLTLSLGVLDLLVAAALVVLPFTPLTRHLGLPTAGCAALGPMIVAWGSAAMVALCGFMLIMSRRVGQLVTVALGALSLIPAIWLMNQSASHAFVMASLLVPAVAQGALVALLLLRKPR